VTIARVALPVAVAQLFDYWVPAGLELHAGAIVRVPLARRRVVGVVVELVEATPVAPEKVVPIGELVALPPLPDDVRELAQFVASYYQAPPGLAFALATPPAGASSTRTRDAARALALTAAGRAALPTALARAPATRALFERLLPEGAVLEPEAIAALAPHPQRVLARWRREGLVSARAPGPQAQGELRLNEAQAQAVASINAAHGRFAPFLLQGVTGSGKTEVYLAAAASVVAAGGQALLLVPEINLTPQLVARVAAALPNARTATLHSALPDGERRSNWEQAARGQADLVLGTRLAVFAALPRLSLIVVDEEHDGSYKQHDGVRYHARDAAVWRAHRLGIPVVLGSATPSLESYAHARAGRYARLLLERRADPRAVPPAVRFVPARDAGRDDGLAPVLVAAIAARLERGEQSLLFVNRRGFAPSLKCSACGWEAGCPRCSARLTSHRAPSALLCHHCGHRERVPRACPSCGNVDLLPLGHGTQRLEQGLAAAFPGARIARVDRDTTRRRHAFADMRARMAGNELDILVGTQMLAKGHDFPRLTLVGVLGADNALYSADFRATERLAALLMQVAGRAGRAELPGEVIVQTDFPDHPLYRALARHDYDAFALDLLGEREACGLPPFSHLALVSAEAHDRGEVDRALDELHAQVVAECREAGLAVEVFAPVVAPLARRAGYERSQMLLRSAQRAELQRLLASLAHRIGALPQRRVRLAIDVDPAALA
jgi:primosomal protein N' (replication factor Y)